MKTSYRKNWKANALAASVFVVSAAAGYTGVSANNPDTMEQTSKLTSTPTIKTTGTPTVPVSATPTATQQPITTIPGGRGRGRGGRDEDHIQGLDTTPPEVELAPAQSDVEATQSTTLVDGAEYYDGEYYGDAVRAGHWGTMQVVVVIEDGKLTDVRIADYPHSTYESDIITRNALPTLISEAIEAQDSNVDFVSRATDTSNAFVQSLDSALLDAAIGMDL